MTRTTIRVGRISVEGMTLSIAGDGFARRLQAAVAAALRQSPAGQHTTSFLPRLRLMLPHSATEADVAAAVAKALRDTLARSRRP